ncbi:MAG: head-tail joining protein [Bacteriophage sp.]|nr:MAG: head-tail joining protein [Bacteriophage sp.]UVM91543.1 MAG: head-tail joining protein [Bacteriophage sp.]UVN01817.1 MAG: head-tail joining protein [Bacteriophage sp.]UVX34517.1 MAG: head-tail joining protein [Bacteriophage sp.]UVX36030.1 MAG: head-tail joining protein [Bacteriophage sp.]
MANILTSRLDRRIEILAHQKHRNEYFEVIMEWVPIRKVWCSVRQQYFKDYQQTFGTTLENTTNIIVRYDTGKNITIANRVRLNGIDYRIINKLEGSFDRDFTTLVCKQVEE